MKNIKYITLSASFYRSVGIGHTHPYPGLTYPYLLTRSDSLPGLRLLGMRGKLRLGRGGAATRTKSSLPSLAAVRRCPGYRAVTDRGLTSSPLSPALTWNIWKSMSDFRFDWSSLDLCQDVVDINCCQYKSFPRTIKQWTSKQRMTVSYKSNHSPLLETSRLLPGVRFCTKQHFSGTQIT